MVTEKLELYLYSDEETMIEGAHTKGSCWAVPLGAASEKLQSNRGYRVPPSISGERHKYIYCEACCYEKGWLW